MLPFPSGTTHCRYNKLKSKSNFFKVEEGISFIWNLTWEPFTGDLKTLIPVAEYKGAPSKKVTPLKINSPVQKAPVKYDSIFPTFEEEVLDLIPKNVLRELLNHYKNADVVEVEINVKTTHTIKG